MVSIQFETLAEFSKPGNSARGAVSAIHSGNAGDVIYSLPTVRTLGITHLILNVYSSPVDPVRRFASETAQALAPLLLSQDYIDRISIVRCGVSLETVPDALLNVDYNLDRFRLEAVERVHLIHAHARALHARVDPNQPFLTVDAGAEEQRPVLAFTPRYKSLPDSRIRELMLCFDNPILLGLPGEWSAIAGISGELRTCTDFLEMARLIQAAPLFVGNPSLPYAIAEGLKTLRIAEIPELPANAFPLGAKGYVMPPARRELLDLLAQLSLTEPRIASCCRLQPLYTELLGQVQSSYKPGASRWYSDVPLMHFIESGTAAYENVPVDHRHVASGRFMLHPNDPGSERAEVSFCIDVAGHNCFDTELILEEGCAHAVRFGLRIEELASAVQEERSIDLQPGEHLPWRVFFRRTAGDIRIVLFTEMARGAVNSHCAWAYFQNPVLRIL